MTNYVIEAPGIGTLVLTTEELRSARARALELREAVEPTRTPDPPADASLVSAEQLQLRTGIPASWWMSQARERRIGEFFKRPTLPFNGYADQVASLYAGMDLRKNY